MPRSYCKIANNQKNRNSMSLIKSVNSVVCTQREYNLDEAQDMGFNEQFKVCNVCKEIQRTGTNT